MPAQATSPTDLVLSEVFSSLQGEGVLIGCRQIFLRLSCCNLDCAYCDTDFIPRSAGRIEQAPGSGAYRPLSNPAGGETVFNLVSDWERLAPGLHHSVSVTGGEPLLQSEALGEWLPLFRRRWPIYLETNGTLPDRLEPLLGTIDWIAMDLKLPSAVGKEWWEIHREFLRLARQVRCQVKVVIAEETPAEEVVTAARLVAEVAPEVPLILQPATVEGRPAVAGEVLMALQTRAAREHAVTRVIPQVHPLLGWA